VWRGTFQTAEGPQDCQLVLHQHLSEARGLLTLAKSDLKVGGSGVDLRGKHLKFTFGDISQFEVRFDGQVEGDLMKGTLSIRDKDKGQEGTLEARREKADLTGTWKLADFRGEHPAQITIERKDGRLTSQYLGQDEAIPITDFYDFGGGFYFTHMVGRNGDTIYVTEKNPGWLIGEGVLEDGQQKGNTEFYPYENKFPGMPQKGNAEFYPYENKFPGMPRKRY